MAKCKKCGKGGLFQKLDSSGFCKKCNLSIELESIEGKIKEMEDKLSDRETLHKSIYEEVKESSLKDISELLEQKNKELQNVTDMVTNQEAAYLELGEKVEKAEKSVATATNRVKKIKSVYESVQHAIKRYDENPDIPPQPESDQLITEIQDILSPTVELKLNCMNVRELRKQFKQNEKTIEVTLEKYKGRYTTKANMAIYQLMVIALKAELQNILFNINFGKLDSAVDNVKKVTEKYLAIAIDGNQSIAPTMKKFIGEIEHFFIEAVKIEYEYFVQKERIKEEQRAIREQMRQEAEERRLLEQQRKQVEKEESKYQAEIASITEQLASTSDNEKIQQLQTRIDELNIQLSEVEAKKDDIIKLQNGKAGYVYIISNLGSFGDDVFKIGMTRRLEPQERVNELGSASVPFPFDVHSFIFSDDAVGLENQMHKLLHDKRVNRVNLRKEFFKASIDELEELTYSLEPTAEFNRTLIAEQYNQSLSLDEIPDDIDINEAIDEDDEDATA